MGQSSRWRRTLSFSGDQWEVKRSESPVGPGPNYFSDSDENVWLDRQGKLHLKISGRDGRWFCSEVVSRRSFGYGRYVFHLASRIDQLDKNVVVGLFTWDDEPEYFHREIDIEFAKWGEWAENNAQYTTWPATKPGKYHPFKVQLKDRYSTHLFNWRPEKISFRSLQGHSVTPPDDSYIVGSWVYAGEDIPPPGNENARINLWLFKGAPPSDGKEVEIIISKFDSSPGK